jgi:NAD(P)H-hydrate epimerase
MKIVTVQQMRQAEADANAAGLSFARMMENAGSAVAQEIARRVSVQGRSVLVLVGPGNNGGDGLVAARYLSDLRAVVSAYLLQARPDGDKNLRMALERKVSVVYAGDDAQQVTLARLVAQADIIIDALLGTGIARPIEGALQEMLTVVAAAVAGRPQRPLIVAIDLPSGLNADTGAVDPVTLPANLTVTFAFPKRGHFLFPGAAYCGEVTVADIGLPAQAAASTPLTLADASDVAALLPLRPRDAHKGTFGRLLVLAGSSHYTGAAYLACMAAYRAGAGLVTLATGRSIFPILAAKSSEVTFLPMPEAEPGYMSADGLNTLREALANYDAVLIGCGLGLHEQTQRLVQQVAELLKGAPLPRLVVDADGLNALAAVRDWRPMLPANAVLTPHPGEMSRLSGLTIEAIGLDRIGLAMGRAAAWGHVVVLKGAYTIVASPEGQATVNPFANPALATAGTGDVLAGVVGGLLAQGMTPYDAAVCGVFLHGLAAQLVTAQIGDTGMLASDLLGALPLAARALRMPSAPPGQA